MLKRALPIVVMFASTIVFAAPPTGSSATVTPVPNITFGQTLLSDPPASAAQALTASNAQPGSASGAKPEVQAAAPAEHAVAGKTEPNEYMPVWSGRSVKITDALLILFTAILAIFTGGLWVSTRALWKETKRGGRTAETAANAAEKSALAAETSADASLISVEASIAAQQPRWLVEAMTVHSRLNYPSTSIARNITVTMANHGSTSAEITRTELRYGVLENLSFLPMECITTDGKLQNVESRNVSEVWEGYTYFRRNDVVMAKITPCFENGKGGLLNALPTDIGFGTTEFIVLRAAARRVRPAFLAKLLSLKTFRALGADAMTGAAGQQRVPLDFVKNFRIALPSLNEQDQILSALETATAEQDAAIERIRSEIALVREYRDRQITDVVTGQVDVRGWVPDPDDVVAEEDLAALGGDEEIDTDGEEDDGDD